MFANNIKTSTSKMFVITVHNLLVSFFSDAIMAPGDHPQREAPPMIGPPGTFPRSKKNQCESPAKLSTTSTFSASSSSSSASSSSSSSSCSSSSSTCSTLSRVSYRKRSNSEASLSSVKSKSVVATGSTTIVVVAWLFF